LRYDPHIFLEELSKIMHTEVQLISETRSECLLNVKHKCPYVTVMFMQNSLPSKSSADSFFGFANLEVQMSMLIGLWPTTNSRAQPSASHQNNLFYIKCIFVGLWMTLTCTQGH